MLGQKQERRSILLLKCGGTSFALRPSPRCLAMAKLLCRSQCSLLLLRRSSSAVSDQRRGCTSIVELRDADRVGGTGSCAVLLEAGRDASDAHRGFVDIQ